MGEQADGQGETQIKVATLSPRAPVLGKAGKLIMITVPGKYYEARKRQDMAQTKTVEGVG